MKYTQNQNITLNALVLVLLALFFLAGTMMWSQSHQYGGHGTMHSNTMHSSTMQFGSMQHGVTQQENSFNRLNSMTWDNTGQ
jgi:hypothetical protein